MSEAAVVDSITKLLDRRHAWWIKTHGTGHGRNGVPDIVGCYRGVPIAIEVKASGGRVARLQDYELRRASAAGARAFVARRVQAVEGVLDAIDGELASRKGNPKGWGSAAA